MRDILPVPHLLGAAFALYAALSLLWSPGGQVLAAFWLALLVGGYYAGTVLRDIRGVWFCFSLIVIANIPWALWDWYTYGLGTCGLAGNLNFFGCMLALAIAATIGYRWWYLLPGLIAGLAWTESRGAIFAGGIACLIGLWWRFRFAAWIAALAAILSVIVMKAGDGTLFQRLGIWQDTINHLAFFGNGFGSFLTSYSGWPIHRNLFAAVAPHAYNDILEMLFDLGIGSILAWGCIITSFEGRNWPDRLICLTFGALTLTYFPLWVVGPMFTLSLGHLSQTKDENPWLDGSYSPRII